MKVFLFDLIPYGAHFEDAKAAKLLPYPLPGHRFDPRGRRAHLRRAPRGVGGDGPARLRRRRAQRAPHHAARPDELAQHDGGGRRAAHQEPEVPPARQPAAAAQSAAHRRRTGDGGLHVARAHPVGLRARRAARIQGLRRADGGIARALRGSDRRSILQAWTEDVFTHQGKFWTYKDISIWPRPYQRPHPPVWMPFTGSKETIECAAAGKFQRRDPHLKPRRDGGHHRLFRASQARRERPRAHARPDLPVHRRLCGARQGDRRSRNTAHYFLYFNQTLWHHGSRGEEGTRAESRLRGFVVLRLRAAGERAESRSTAKRSGDHHQADVEARVASGELDLGQRQGGRRAADRAGRARRRQLVLLNLNLGALPNDMFMEQVRRFGREVLPQLHAHQVKRVPAAERAVA